MHAVPLYEAMTDRLERARRLLSLCRGSDTSMHVGALAVFCAPDGGIDVDALERYMVRRTWWPYRAFVNVFARSRRNLARPVWVDDDDFDLDHHVRRSILPGQAASEQLEEFVARVMARPLDRDRPCGSSTSSRDWRQDGSLSSPRPITRGRWRGAVALVQVLLDPAPAQRHLEPDETGARTGNRAIPNSSPEP